MTDNSSDPPSALDSLENLAHNIARIADAAEKAERLLRTVVFTAVEVGTELIMADVSKDEEDEVLEVMNRIRRPFGLYDLPLPVREEEA